MKSAIRILFIILLYGLLSGFTAQQNQTETLSESINAILKATNEDLTIGIVIADANSGKILYQKNPNHHFTPASTLKMITAYVALELLGPNYTFQTSIYGNLQQLKSNVLCDNLYFKFSGNPVLTSDDINIMLAQLKRLGIHRITGNIIIDDSHDNNTASSWPSGICYEDRKFCFGAPVSALIINQNCIAATLCPTKHKRKTVLTLQNSTKSARVKNKTVTNIHQPENATLDAHENNDYLLSGNINQPLNLKIAVQNQRLYAKQMLKSLLIKNNIGFKQITFGKVRNTNAIVNLDSPPLSNLIVTMLKTSDNVISNAIFKSLASTQHLAITWENAAEVFKKYLQDQLSINSDQLIISDGAGLSRYNLITPLQLVTVLNAIHRNPQKESYFKYALPISGIDGTLKERMKEYTGKIFAKTGTENAISSLTGFIETQNHQLLTFAIMINAGISNPKNYKDLEDKICALIIASNTSQQFDSAPNKSLTRH